jgi:hypothetical protein
MNLGIARHLFALASLISIASCRPASTETEKPSFPIIATDAGFEAPETVPAGIRHIVFENHGSEIHEGMLVKLPNGMSPAQYVAAVKSGALFPKGSLDFSGAGLTSPGEKVEVWTKVEPGQYIIICWNEGHAKKIPVHPFTVQYAVADDPVPKEDMTVKLLDYRFDLDGSLENGTQVFRIETLGPSMHEMDIFRLHQGKTLADVRAWRKGDGSVPAPADAMGGILDSHDIRRVVWLQKNFRPGRYVLHCEMPATPDAHSGDYEITHADLGMVRE